MSQHRHLTTSSPLGRSRRNNLRLAALATCIATTTFPKLEAAVPMTGTATHTENFDTLATTGSPAWADNSTIANWYSNRVVYLVGAGAANSGGLYSFGAAAITERAIGSVGSGSASPIYGVLLQNTSAGPIEVDSIAYTGEQWRNGGNLTAQSLTVDYQVSPTVISTVTSGTFQPLTALNFTSPVATATAAALDGNLAGNRNAISATTQIIVPAGAYLMVRWSDINDAGNDHGLSVDDLTISWKPSSGLDTTPPSVSALTPADEGAPFLRATVSGLALTFNENVKAGTAGSVSIKRASNDVEVRSFAVGDAAVADNGVSYFFDGPSPLAAGESYYVEIAPGAIEDIAGNDFAGYSGKLTTPGNTSWTFNVAPAPAAPAVAVNKFSANGSPDMVELLVIGTGAGGLPVDLRGMIIKDFASLIASDNGGKYEFSTNTLWSAVPVGTLIVLAKNNNSVDTTVGSGDFKLQVGLDDAVYFANLDIANAFDISGDDMVMLKQAGSLATGVSGGIHALAGSGIPGTLFTSFTGAKVLAPTGGAGVAVNNSTTGVADYVEGFDATGGISFTPSKFGSANSGANRSYIASLRGAVAADGDGLATVVNVTAASPYLNKTFFDDGQTGQSAKITLTASITDPANTLTDVKIVVPASLGVPGSAAIGGLGAAGASVSVTGQEITISSASITAANAIEVTIDGLTTPVPALITDNGAYPLAVSTAPSGGTLTPIDSSPVVRVVIPISALRDVDSNGVPSDGSSIVAVEGICTEENLGTVNTQAFIQDATAGINVFSPALISPALTRGNRYAVVGQILHFNGLTEIVPATGDIIDLGTSVEPVAEVVSVATLLSNAEAYEGKLVKVLGLSKVSGTWSSGNNVTLKDSTPTNVTVRIQAGSTATTEPTYPVNVTGIWGQTDGATPFTTGYYIQPRNAADLEAAALSDFDTWALATGATGGMPGDTDLDGRDNAFEYAFGLNPTSGASVNPFTVPFNPATGLFTYSRRNDAITGFTYTYQYNTSLSGTWTAFTPAVTPVSDEGTPVETITVTVPAAQLAEPRLFIRIVTP
jgi:hypothetical protein